MFKRILALGAIIAIIMCALFVSMYVLDWAKFPELTVIYGHLNCQDFPDLAASEFVEADVTVSHFVGSSEEVNPLFTHSPLAFAMHGIENFRFLISIH
jgi:hypothetical protein